MLICVDTNRRAAKHYLSGEDVLYGASLESGLQGSGIPAEDFSVDVIDFLAKLRMSDIACNGHFQFHNSKGNKLIARLFYVLLPYCSFVL